MGVRRAVEMVLDAPGKHENPIYTYGPLIHNPQVLNLLNEKGISDINEIPDLLARSGNMKKRGTVLIRAHGVPPQVKDDLKNAGFTVIDATCPRVIKVQTIIRKHTEQGYEAIIIGDNDHPEVTGLLGYAGEKGHVVGTMDDFESLQAFDKAIIVAQTTQNTDFFEDIKDLTGSRLPHYKIFDTICDSTEKRQEEVKHLASSVDALIVVGGYNSGNTKRLAETAKQAGIPAYHIETESELDLKALAPVRHIGITAGASTPNWIIKRVFRSLESLPFDKSQGWRSWLFKVQRTLLLTNIYVAFGAGCLCYACTQLLEIYHYDSYVFISMLYVLSMHILNNLTGMKGDRYNDPDRASFYDTHMIFLTALALIAGGAGLIKAYTMGHLPFLTLLVMSIMGLSYNLKLVPDSVKCVKYRSIRDIPGSKTVLIAVAWGVVTSLFPSLSASGKIDIGTLIVFMLSTFMVFVRTAFFDILDMQGDRIMGKDTIPILMGEKRTMIFLKSLLAVIFILLLSGIFDFTSNIGFALAICPALMFIVLYAHEQGYMMPGIRLEFLIETHFVLSGIITLFWSLVMRNQGY